MNPCLRIILLLLMSSLCLLLPRRGMFCRAFAFSRQSTLSSLSINSFRSQAGGSAVATVWRKPFAFGHRDLTAAAASRGGDDRSELDNGANQTASLAARPDPQSVPSVPGVTVVAKAVAAPSPLIDFPVNGESGAAQSHAAAADTHSTAETVADLNTVAPSPQALPLNGTDETARDFPTLQAPEGTVPMGSNSTTNDYAQAPQQAQAQQQQPPPQPRVDTQSVLDIDPADVEIVTIRPNETTAESTVSQSAAADLIQSLPFVSMFRGSANYIANHRNTVAVYHIPGGLLELTEPQVFRDLMNDVALTWLLGIKVVLVVGCRHQMEKRRAQLTGNDISTLDDAPHGLRVTDADMLRIVKEEAGYVRFEVERQLARSLRMQGGQAKGYADGNVVSGNFYSAQPFGILGGVDYKYTGFVRRVEVEKIKHVMESRDICLLTTLGVSPSGEVFNCNSESLAATVAGALSASKVVFFTEREMEMRNRVHGNKIQSLRMSDAKHLLEYLDVKTDKKGFVKVGPKYSELGGDEDEDNNDNDNKSTMDLLLKVGASIQALEQGVKRAHIISPKHGALLQELYTRDGSGTLISGDLYEGIRRANELDVSAIYDLISPLIQMGTLVDRPKAVLEKDIDTYYVYTRDNHIVACGQLKKFEDGFAEIGCLVVNQEYRSRGRGDAMLGYLERICVLNGLTTIFVLSTQTMEWFVERGFDPVTVDRLPPSRQATYNYERASKIYLKRVESMRDLDASELWWNR